MIETELRELLADRAGTVADNPARLSQVHARVGGIRRRRAAGAALALVLVALAGLALTRLPGKPATLPAGVPAGPYFSDDGVTRQVPGYRDSDVFTFSGDARWSVSDHHRGLGVASMVVAACQRPGELVLHGLTSQDQRLDCRVRVDGHYEGALPLPDEPGPASVEVSAQPPSSGTWTVGVLQALYPDRIPPANLPTSLLTGTGSPGGGRMTVTLPDGVTVNRTMGVTVLCIRGVRLDLTIGGRPLVDIVCDDAHAVGPGLVNGLVPPERIRALGLRGLQQVTIDVRSVGRQTDQWAILTIA